MALNSATVPKPDRLATEVMAGTTAAVENIGAAIACGVALEVAAGVASG